MRAMYWDGYELDGSDTSFEVEVADITRARQVVVALLKHPLWETDHGAVVDPDADWAPHRSTPSPESYRLSFDEAANKVAAGELDGLPLIVRAKRQCRLEPSLLGALALHSPKRQPPEPAYLVAKQPCVIPDGLYLDPHVSLTVRAKAEGARAAQILLPAEAGLAAEWLAEPHPCVHITLGPGFIYEYAMELVQLVTEQNVDVQISGGLDCANGWTWGCTYAATLYAFQKIPLDGPIEQALPPLLRSKLIHRPFFKGGVEKLSWRRLLSRTKQAKDIQFAAGGASLLSWLEREPHGKLSAAIERFIDANDQARAVEYVEHCACLRKLRIPAQTKRDLSLAYLCLPAPRELPPALRRELINRQLAVLNKVDFGSEDYRFKSGDGWFFSLDHRVVWLGIDDDDGTHLALWVRPWVAQYAADVVAHVCRHQPR